MRNILLTLRFLGTRYHGWQVQENAHSVQEELQDAVEQLFGARDPITGCSRTDAGVHADMYCCTLRTDNPISCFKLIAALNAKLPDDIAVCAAEDVPEDFHPRYSCTSKTYEYHFYNGSARNPFYDDRALFVHRPLDEAFLDRQARDFLGTHDFTSLSNSREVINDNVRTVTEASVTRDGDLVVFRVTADGFLYNMVRNMAGLLLWISDGKREAGSIPDILEARDRNAAGITAPAHGLRLKQVTYPDKRKGGDRNGGQETP